MKYLFISLCIRVRSSLLLDSRIDPPTSSSYSTSARAGANQAEADRIRRLLTSIRTAHTESYAFRTKNEMYLTKKRKLSENQKPSDAGAQSEELPPLPGRGQSEETNGTRLRISDSEESTVIDSGNGLSGSTEDLEAAARGKEQTGRVSLPSNPSHPTRSEEEKLVLDNVVDWDGPNDSQNPLNKSEAAKWTILLVLGSATLCVTCASSMIASTYPGVQEDFDVSREVATIPLTL